VARRSTCRSSGAHSQLVALFLAFAVSACSAAPSPDPSTGSAQQAAGPERRGGAITVAVINAVPSMGPIGTSSTTSGGFLSAAELHSAPLVTSDVHSRRPVGRLAERVPTIENGDVSLGADGRMQVVYHLRHDVTWQDGAPFTAQDLVFSYTMNSDPGLPILQEQPFGTIETVAAPDDFTFAITFARPYNAPDQMGLRRFWPMPRHILEPAYRRYLASMNADEVVNLPYWTSEYVHLGPFRLASFDPADTIVLQAYDGYFLGRPKLDTIRIKIFSDPNAMYANLLSGTVDIFLENTLPSNLGFELMDRWNSSGEGTVYLKRSTQRFLSPQMRPGVQVEPSVISDVRVRAALYHALDREGLSEGLQNGHRELAAWELLYSGEPLYDAVKDAFRRYAYDPERAKAMLREAGWTAGADGVLRSDSDGRPLRAPISATSGRTGEQELAAIADYWRRIGASVEELTIPSAQVRNAEYRALYPGWEASAQGGGDEILGRLEGPAASAENRWVGNRGGYDNSRAQQLVDAYRSSLSFDAQFQAMKAISDFVADELPFLVLYSTAVHIGVSSRLKALDDNDGGDSVGRNYGSYSRNGHLWELR